MAARVALDAKDGLMDEQALRTLMTLRERHVFSAIS
jgi:hypothetical protein